MISRINNNDYIFSRMSGPRELLYVEKITSCQRYVVEQPQRKDLAFDAKYTFNIPNKQYIYNADVFYHSLATMSTLGKAESIETRHRRITRIQFKPQHAIKWAAYRADDAIYFAPYNVGYNSISDIFVKREKTQKFNLATITISPTMALDADLSGANEE